MTEANYCIVVGSQRSGTTLTAQILGSHTRSVVIDEEDGLYTWTSSLMDNADSSEDFLAKAIQNAKNKYSKPEMRFAPSGLLPIIQLIVLKAPNLTYSWAQLATLMPQAKIVYLFRSVNAIVASMKKLASIPIVENQIRLMRSNKYVLNKFSSEIDFMDSGIPPMHKKMALVALIKMSFVEEFRKSGFDVLKMEYRDLIENPEDSIGLLLGFNALEYQEQCKNFSTQYQGFGPGLTDRTRELDNKSIESWKTQLSHKENSEIQSIVEEFNSRHQIQIT